MPGGRSQCSGLSPGPLFRRDADAGWAGGGFRPCHRLRHAQRTQRRVYRLRTRCADRSQWLEIAFSDLRIIDDALWDAVRAEVKRRAICDKGGVLEPTPAQSPAGKPRKKRLLSGLIKSSTCGNRLSVRKGAQEQAVMAVLQNHLFTEEYTRISQRRSTGRQRRSRAARSTGSGLPKIALRGWRKNWLICLLIT